MATIPITKIGAEKLKAELHQLKTVDRPWVINAISEARAQGDLSENAEYEAAKDRQGFVEGRIQEIEGKLSVAQIIDPSDMDAGGKVVFGSTIELEDEESGNKVTYQIVGEDEADIKFGRVNISSPIARALIGKDGRIEKIQVIESENEILNAAAVTAVKETTFTPAKQNGQPVRVWTRVPITFKLR